MITRPNAIISHGVKEIRTPIILASKASAMTKLGDNPASFRFRMTGALAPNARAVPSVRTITNFAGQVGLVGVEPTRHFPALPIVATINP